MSSTWVPQPLDRRSAEHGVDHQENHAPSSFVSRVRRRAKSGWTFGERIDERNPERFEIVYIARNDAQATNERRGCNQGVLEVVIGPTMHELRPATEYVRVHRNDVIRLSDAVEPTLDLPGLGSVLFAGDLYTGLDLTDCHGREMKILFRCVLYPRYNALMRFRFA
jgi:hypothetical protein